MTARTLMPVLPQEDPKELEERIQQAIATMQPRNPFELELVRGAVLLSAEIDRAERIGTAHLAHRVRMATRSAADATSAREVKKVHELGSKLFFQSVIGPGYSAASPDDYPAVIIRRLEESAEGCRWLLARWGELLNVVNCEADWGDAEIVRLVGLLGKRGIEAHFDPELNALFHAFDQLGDRLGQNFWCERRDRLPLGYNGGLKYLSYRTIAEPPANKNEALVLICTIIEREVRRLEELLAEHEEIETDEATERYDRAALDCSRAFERHRRSQSAKTRELLRTLEAFRKMRKEEFGTGNGGDGMADGKCQMTNGKCQMADDKCPMADGKCQMTDGKCQMADDKCQLAVEQGQMTTGGGEMTDRRRQGGEGCLGTGVPCDSNPVVHDSTDDEIGHASHEAGHTADPTSPPQCAGPGLDESKIENPKTKTRGAARKAPIKANIGSMQVSDTQALERENAELTGQKQSQLPKPVAGRFAVSCGPQPVIPEDLVSVQTELASAP